MKIEEAINLAIKGGWGKERFSAEHLNLRIANTDIGSIDIPLDCIFLDQLFWQALGKELGWHNYNYCPDCHEEVKECLSHGIYFCGNCGENGSHIMPVMGWKYHWHSLIDYLSEGKTVAQYFEELK